MVTRACPLVPLRGFDPAIGWDARWAKRIEREILINLSGIAAEANFSRRWNWAGAGGDYESSEILAMYVKPSPLEASAYLQARQARAFYDLRSKRNWPLVQSVAALLVQHRRVSYKMVISDLKACRKRQRSKINPTRVS